MYTEALTPDTKRILEALGTAQVTRNVYLAGGSALALYYGHRFSVDLDWFGEDFSFTEEFRRSIASLGELKIIDQSEHTFHGHLDGVEISFFHYPYRLLDEKQQYSENIMLASEKDIACMKLDAAATRGTKKDFIDLYFILQRISLEELLKLMSSKFEVQYNTLHLLKALTYFEDAERDAMPQMIEEVSWSDIMSFFLEEQKRISHTLL